LLRSATPIDTAVVPVGDGALITGMARWLKEHSPNTRVVGVCAEGAPAVARAWAGRPVADTPVDTIADGIAVRVPVPAAVPRLRALVDDMVLVPDDAIRDAMSLARTALGLVLEPAGAIGLAAIAVAAVPGETIATVLTGGNV
ncbi:MAG: pyridoxal-phosphate dependent enzyme, partial [Saccharothrix sp.]|nr:pyridoxal-phosphate dependent enzyme [Saccharothrix sp.]